MARPFVSVITVTYNGERTIQATIDSVLAQDYGNFEYIVVDNGSNDSTVDIIKSNASRGVKLVETGENIGMSGYNIGAKISKGDFILCVNQDGVLKNYFISQGVEAFTRDKKIAALQAKSISKDSNIIDSTGLVIFKNRRAANRGQGQEDKGQYDNFEEVFGVDGATPFYRRAALEDVKLPNTAIERRSRTEYDYCYDQDFFMYKEDIDLSWRLRLFGWKIAYNPQMVVYNERSSVGEKFGSGQGLSSIARVRRRQKQYVRYHSFKNQRLMQIKNELPWIFFKHLPWILPKEIVSWIYVLFFEPRTWPAIGELIQKAPRAWEKRRVIMAKKKVEAGEMEKWFN